MVVAVFLDEVDEEGGKDQPQEPYVHRRDEFLWVARGMQDEDNCSISPQRDREECWMKNECINKYGCDKQWEAILLCNMIPVNTRYTEQVL